jgi:putative transcriptional regulator
LTFSSFSGILSYKGANGMSKIILKNRLKVARAEKDISQEELANLVDVTRQTISSIETGQYCPSALLAFLLAKKLEKPVEQLFFLEGDEK